jgi:hypothetical protein
MPEKLESEERGSDHESSEAALCLRNPLLMTKS